VICKEADTALDIMMQRASVQARQELLNSDLIVVPCRAVASMGPVFWAHSLYRRTGAAVACVNRCGWMKGNSIVVSSNTPRGKRLGRGEGILLFATEKKTRGHSEQLLALDVFAGIFVAALCCLALAAAGGSGRGSYSQA